MMQTQQLDVLTTLAVDMGYEIRSDSAHLIPMPSVRSINLDSNATTVEKIRVLSKVLADDPQLALYEMDQSQELALREGRAA